jgi:hypothetical protein
VFLLEKNVYEVAYIYPFHSRKKEEVFGLWYIFWEYLKNFWPKEKLSSWEAELFPRGINDIGVEKVYNLITLSRDAYASWSRGAFALKPNFVYNNSTTLKVQFFWQIKLTDTRPTVNLMTIPFSNEGLDRNEGAMNSVISYP